MKLKLYKFESRRLNGKCEMEIELVRTTRDIAMRDARENTKLFSSDNPELGTLRTVYVGSVD